ncbi:MAG: guanylate kinase [Bowdeniella nasicola]|nr:guanylate kinase [Bowdeniella nasicola]
MVVPRRAPVLVLVGPSGVGKGSVVSEVQRHHPNVWVSISATTRPPRPGEVDGEHYFFIDESRFRELIDTDQMLEWAWVHGKHRYGTPREPVETRCERGIPVILEIDLQGARQVRTTLPSATFCFLAPPSTGELERRLRSRATETEAQIAQRLQTARTEMAAIGEFEHVIVNNTVAQAAREVADLLHLVE